MEISTFASAPAINQSKLPFAVSKAKIEAWLHDLPDQDAYASCKEIFYALQTINNKDLPVKKVALAMEVIGNYLNVFARPIERKFIDAGFPLNEEESNHLSLLVWTYCELAKGFAFCISEKHFSAEDNAFLIYSGLKYLGNALLYVSMGYEAPFKGFWKLCFQYYQLAKQLELLEKTISRNSVLLGTINRKFRQILCFYHCGSNQLQPREMKTVFQFLNGYAEQAAIRSTIKQKQARYYLAFDTRQDHPPSRLIDISQSDAENIRYFSTINVAKAIHHDIQEQPVGTDILHSVKISLLNKILKTLSMSQSRKFTRIDEDKIEFGLMGFDDSVHYLRNTNHAPSSPDEVEITEYDPRIAGIWTAPNLELLPEGEEMVQKMWNTLKKDICHDQKINQIFTTRKNIASNDNIWSAGTQTRKQDDSVKLGEFNVKNSSINGYGMMLKNGHQVKTNINDLIGFTNNEDNRIEIGLIRRICKTKHGGISFGIELMALEAKAICISRQHNHEKTEWALFLPGIKTLNKPDSIMFSSNQFAPGDFICLHQGIEKIYCRLNKLLHKTEDISHVEVYYPATSSASASNSSQR